MEKKKMTKLEIVWILAIVSGLGFFYRPENSFINGIIQSVIIGFLCGFSRYVERKVQQMSQDNTLTKR